MQALQRIWLSSILYTDYKVHSQGRGVPAFVIYADLFNAPNNVLTMKGWFMGVCALCFFVVFFCFIFFVTFF